MPDKLLHIQPGKPQLQQTTAQQQQRAAEVKELRAKVSVAKKELAETPWLTPADMAKLPVAEQNRLTAVWKARKEAVEAGANLTN